MNARRVSCALHVRLCTDNGSVKMPVAIFYGKYLSCYQVTFWQYNTRLTKQAFKLYSYQHQIAHYGIGFRVQSKLQYYIVQFKTGVI